MSALSRTDAWRNHTPAESSKQCTQCHAVEPTMQRTAICHQQLSRPVVQRSAKPSGNGDAKALLATSPDTVRQFLRKSLPQKILAASSFDLELIRHTRRPLHDFVIEEGRAALE